MLPILTITLNPTVDFSSTVETVTPGVKLRCTPPQIDPGGGGVNVSRAIRLLGGDSKAVVATAGRVGAMLASLLADGGLNPTLFPVLGETRQSLSVIEETTGNQFRFVMPGPSWTNTQIADLLARIKAELLPGMLVVLSGSQPPGVARDFALRVNDLVVNAGARLVLDTSGAALARVAQGRHTPIDVLRMNSEEAEELAGRRLANPHEVANYAQSLLANGVAHMVIVAVGDEGCVLATARGRWQCSAPKVEVRSKTGAGDSFVAALTLGLARRMQPEQALRHAAAAAASAVTTEATELCRAEDIAQLLDQAVLLPI